jgi:hypothetical protein
MKSSTLALVLAFIFGVSTFAQETKSDLLKSFLSEVITIESSDLSAHEPITRVAALAAQKAAKQITLAKENIAEALADAKTHKHAIIIVENHTIVKITDLDDCSQSGAWGACMPAGTGYIQRSGQLNEKEGYINNIIGIPDSQQRTMYLFD